MIIILESYSHHSYPFTLSSLITAARALYYTHHHPARPAAQSFHMASLASKTDSSTPPTQSDAAAGATSPAGAASVSGGAGTKTSRTTSAEILSLKSGPRVCEAVNGMLGNMKLRRWNAIECVGRRHGKTAVLRAKDSHLPEGYVALKLMDCTDDNTRRRFKREVEHTKTLSHPNIVTCKEGPFASDDGTLMFCVLEWISGGSLEQMRKAEANKRFAPDFNPH